MGFLSLCSHYPSSLLPYTLQGREDAPPNFPIAHLCACSGDSPVWAAPTPFPAPQPYAGEIPGSTWQVANVQLVHSGVDNVLTQWEECSREPALGFVTLCKAVNVFTSVVIVLTSPTVSYHPPWMATLHEGFCEKLQTVERRERQHLRYCYWGATATGERLPRDAVG